MRSALWPSLLCVFLKYPTLLRVTQRRSHWECVCAATASQSFSVHPPATQVLSVFVPAAPSGKSQSSLFFTRHSLRVTKLYPDASLIVFVSATEGLMESPV